MKCGEKSRKKVLEMAVKEEEQKRQNVLGIEMMLQKVESDHEEDEGGEEEEDEGNAWCPYGEESGPACVISWTSSASRAMPKWLTGADTCQRLEASQLM